jgi:hypothetical protein
MMLVERMPRVCKAGIKAIVGGKGSEGVFYVFLFVFY